jgi:site-specific DNA-methyltransferase (adenine-specific)
MKTVKLATFIENPDNPYKATEADLARLKGKLERVPKGLRCMRLGYVTDHVARDGTSYKGQRVVISGNKRLRELKIIYGDAASVPAEWFCDCTDMTPEERREFIVSANTVDGIPDAEKLLEQYDRDELGDLMGDKALEEILKAAETDKPKDGQTDADAVPSAPETPVSKRGEVYICGEHRLMCGDSTSAEDFARLMGGERADIAFTSPPYGASASARLRKHYKPGEKSLESFYIEHGDKSGEWADLIRGALANIETHSVAQFVNIQMLADNKHALLEIVAERAARLCDVLVWDKQKAPPQMQSAVLNNEFEFIFVFTEKGSRVIPFADFHGTESNIVRIKPGANEFSEIHKAVFPVALPEKILALASGARSVLDPFCGTGTTIVAAEKKGIRAFGMELDPHYCDVIRKRWAEFVHGEGCDWKALTPRAANVPRKEGK